VASVGLWLAGTASQVGALPVTPPLGRLFAVQVGASFANHLVPGGVGGMAVNLRFLRRQGVAVGTGLAALGLNTAAGIVSHLALLVVVAVFVPHRVGAVTAAVPHHGPAALVAVGLSAFAIAAVCSLLARRRTPKADGQLGVRDHLAALRPVLTDRPRALALWAGALAAPVLHALVMYAVCQALGLSIGFVAVAAVYATMSALSALVPAPGGFGALDLLLTAGLVAVGIAPPAAVAATVAYRLITVWLPLVPSGCLLAVLIQRRVI
jgi:uncharacterized membrane protein YbhN (UPF0104 family)